MAHEDNMNTNLADRDAERMHVATQDRHKKGKKSSKKSKEKNQRRQEDDQDVGYADVSSHQDQQKAKQKAAKKALMASLPTHDQEGIPYSKIQRRRMARRVKDGLNPIPTEEEELYVAAGQDDHDDDDDGTGNEKEEGGVPNEVNVVSSEEAQAKKQQEKNLEGDKRDVLVSIAMGLDAQVESGKADSEIDEEKTTKIRGHHDEADTQLDSEIPRDSFSIFYVAKTTQEHLLPILVFLMQMWILSLIFYNLLQTQGSPLDLTMNIPVDVPIEVTIAQYLACLVSVFTAQDFTDGIYFVRMRIFSEYDYVRQGDENQRPPYSFKWEASNLMRMVEGLLNISVCFIIIVQSTTVIDLFLDFAGVAFVSQLDDVAFSLAERGFLGVTAKQLSDTVLRHKAHAETNDEHRGIKTRKTARVVVFATIPMVMWIGLSAFAMKQDEFHWACKSVSLTVGENVWVQYRTLGGTYILSGSSDARRPVYVKEQGEGRAFLAYCEPASRWTVNPGDFDEDPCGEYQLQSEITRTYDITEISELQYYTGDVVDGGIKCKDCSTESTERRNETCGWKGSCEEQQVQQGEYEFKKKTCKCDDGYFGDSCQFQGPCSEFKFQDGEPFPGYLASFDLLYYDTEALFVHDRPAYIQRWSEIDRDYDDFTVLLFDGGRWLVIDSPGLWDYDPTTNIEEYLFEEFDAWASNFTTSYISELSYEGLPASIPFRALLTNNENEQTVGRLGPDEYTLICADCDDDPKEEYGPSFCLDWEGETNSTLCQKEKSTIHGEVNRCKCEPGFLGPLCQVRPVEGEIVLHLEHGANGTCSVCGKKNLRTVRDLIGFNDQTCIPFPREPLHFKGGNGTVISRQLGVNLNKTHFSVLVSDSNRTFEYGNNTRASETICAVQESTVIYSIERNEVPEDKAQADFVVLLDKTDNFTGRVVDPSDIDCITNSDVNEYVCEARGGARGGSLLTIYNESGLDRAWIQLNLVVTK